MSVEVPRLSGKRLEPHGDKAVIGYCACSAKWAGENLCHCSLCHLTFMSVTGFDKHRSGPVGITQCRTADGLREIGMEPNELGYWRKPRPLDTIPVGRPQ